MEKELELRFSKTHEWVRVQDDTATVGISDYAQSELGDIVNIELPVVGAIVQAGNTLGSIDSVKAVSDIIAPISGEIVEVNEDILTAPETINEEPYSSGWLVIVKMDNPSEVNDLMSADEYEVFTSTQ